ncbi:MAG: prepilin peptidase [Vulcanimicrobiaceae bacterium]
MYLIILAACAIGACTDVASKRIPNALTITLALLALGMHATMGLPSLALSLLTMTLIAAAGFFLFSFRLIGGGDVKLIAAVSGALSFPACLPFLLYTMLAGGVLGLVVAASRGTLKESCYSAASAAHPLLYRTGGFALPPATSKMPYGVAIFFGAALTVLSSIYPLLRFQL